MLLEDRLLLLKMKFTKRQYSHLYSWDEIFLVEKFFEQDLVEGFRLLDLKKNDKNKTDPKVEISGGPSTKSFVWSKLRFAVFGSQISVVVLVFY